MPVIIELLISTHLASISDISVFVFRVIDNIWFSIFTYRFTGYQIFRYVKILLYFPVFVALLNFRLLIRNRGEQLMLLNALNDRVIIMCFVVILFVPW